MAKQQPSEKSGPAYQKCMVAVLKLYSNTKDNSKELKDIRRYLGAKEMKALRTSWSHLTGNTGTGGKAIELIVKIFEKTLAKEPRARGVMEQCLENKPPDEHKTSFVYEHAQRLVQLLDAIIREKHELAPNLVPGNIGQLHATHQGFATGIWDTFSRCFADGFTSHDQVRCCHKGAHAWNVLIAVVTDRIRSGFEQQFKHNKKKKPDANVAPPPVIRSQSEESASRHRISPKKQQTLNYRPEPEFHVDPPSPPPAPKQKQRPTRLSERLKTKPNSLSVKTPPIQRSKSTEVHDRDQFVHIVPENHFWNQSSIRRSSEAPKKVNLEVLQAAPRRSFDWSRMAYSEQNPLPFGRSMTREQSLDWSPEEETAADRIYPHSARDRTLKVDWLSTEPPVTRRSFDWSSANHIVDPTPMAQRKSSTGSRVPLGQSSRLGYSFDWSSEMHRLGSMSEARPRLSTVSSARIADVIRPDDEVFH